MAKSITELIKQKWKKTANYFSKYTQKKTSNLLFTEGTGELVLIIILFLAVSYNEDVFTFSQSYFGKIFVLFLVFYYFLLNPKLGLLVSILLIFYYYSDLIQSYYSYGYEGYGPILTNKEAKLPFFEGKFIGKLTAPDNRILHIYTDITGNLKEFKTKFEGNLIINLNKDDSYIKYDSSNNLSIIPNIDSSFSYVDGDIIGFQYEKIKEYPNNKRNFKGILKGKVKYQRTEKSINLRMNSLDSSVLIVNDNIHENFGLNAKTKDISSAKKTSYVDSSLPSIPIKPIKKKYYNKDENTIKKVKKDEPDILDLSSFLKPEIIELPDLSKSSIVIDKPTNSEISHNLISMPSDKNLSISQSENTSDKISSDKILSETTYNGNATLSETTYNGNTTLSETTYNGNATLSETTYNGNTILSEPSYTESFKNMETSQIIDAYPFTVNQSTIPSKFYTKYNYKLPSKNVNKSFFSEFFTNLLTISETKKENFTDNIKIPYQNQYQNNEYSKTQSQEFQNPNTLSLQTKNDYQNNQNPNPEPINNKQTDQFRKSYCVNHQLTYKNTPVRSEIAEHIFPNLQINDLAGSNGVKCNPCDTSCPIFLSSIDQRLENENIIQKRTRPEYKTQNWESKFFDVFLPNPNYPDLDNSKKNDNRSYLIPSNARIMPFLD